MASVAGGKPQEVSQCFGSQEMKVLVNGEDGHQPVTGVAEAAQRSSQMKAENSLLDWQHGRHGYP